MRIMSDSVTEEEIPEKVHAAASLRFPVSVLSTYSNPLFHCFNSSNSSFSGLPTYNFHFWNGISLAADVQLMDNGGVKKFKQWPVKAPQGGEENVLKRSFLPEPWMAPP